MTDVSTLVETFVPLYLTNRCDAVCTMCSMRRGNTGLTRLPIDVAAAERQLEIIRKVEGISAVCFLTGEYEEGEERRFVIETVATLIQRAFDRGFEKVYINIGALTANEIDVFARRHSSDSPIVLSLFQETYDRHSYARFFGKPKASNPKGDFDFRLTTPDRWLAAGFKHVDLGVLVGLVSLDSDVPSLIQHATALRSRGADVALSLPRIRGMDSVPHEIPEHEYVEWIRTVSEACPWAKLIVTTRESVGFIRSVLPFVGIVSPGTSDVLPYTETGLIPNRRETSQFVVAAMRPRPSSVLDSLGLPQGSIRYFGGSRA